MEAHIAVCMHDMRARVDNLPKAASINGNNIVFSCPEPLKAAGFPVKEATFVMDQAFHNPTSASIAQQIMPSLVSNFSKNKQNAVIFSYGVRSTPKRQLMIGSSKEEGFAQKLIAEAVTQGKGVMAVSCFILGASEKLIDLTNLKNELGVIVDSVKEGPRVRMVDRVKVRNSDDVRGTFAKIIQNYQQVFAAVIPEQQPTPELEALPPYNGDTVMLQLLRYESEEAFTDYNEANSLNFVALGDSERPVLCGVDAAQQANYERTQRILVSAAGIVSSIKCSRLRIPFGKSKMSQLLRRAYNSERRSNQNNNNAPTRTIMLIHAFTDGKWSEETYHSLSMVRRVCNTLGSTGIGSILRDLPVEKWRLDQDIAELRDEIAIAKTVYDYRPCIFESSKNIPNIKEEELKRLSVIQAKRNEAREKQLFIVRQRAQEEAAKLIKEQEASSGTTLAELEKTLEAKKRENASLQADRDERTREYEQTLEKIRKKKEEEEAAAEKLREEVTQLEEQLVIRQVAIQNKQKQLEMAKLDKAKGREAVLRERESVQAMRKNVLAGRRRQREQWIKQIKDINEKVLAQIRCLAQERKAKGEQASQKEESAEQAVVADIKTIEDYLPKLISLEDTPVNPEETETIRRQFDEVFSQEKQSYLTKIEEEKAKKEKLEKGLEAYRNRVLEAAQTQKKKNLQEAEKKKQHLHSLIDEVLNYLRRGVRMTKISSKGNLRRRYYFLSEDYKRIHSCELDNQGEPINRRKPPVTIFLTDIKSIILGIYTPSFCGFSSEAELVNSRSTAVTDNGTFRSDVTQSITPSTLGINNYRAFALLLEGGKSLEIVCDTDSDYEAWMVGLKRLMGIKLPVEMAGEQKARPTMELDGKRAETTSEMKYGGRLDVRKMHGFVSLSPEEAQFCSEHHTPPALFLRMRQELSEKGQSGSVTVYDVRVSSGLDLIRSWFLFNYFSEKRLIVSSL